MRKMKDSGIKWIGEIPDSWCIERLCYLIYEYKTGPFGSSLIMNKLNDKGDILIYNPEIISMKNLNLSSNKYLPEYRKKAMQSFFVKPGDIIFPIVGSLGRAMLITKSMPEGIINQRLAKFRLLANKMSYPFFMRLFGESDFFQPYIELTCRGSIIVNLTKIILNNMPVPVPPLLEQNRIASYLNDKCSRIDDIIFDIQSEIDTLEKYKRSVITEAVTKGLDKNVEMKESGVSWIGKIPKGWSSIKLKYTASIVRGGSPRPINQYLADSDDGYNWIRIGDTQKGDKFIRKTKLKIIKEGLPSTRFVKENTLLLTNSMSYGEPYVLKINGCIHDGWLAFSDYKKIDKLFLYYCLLSESTHNQFAISVSGSVVVNLNIEKVKNAYIALPPLSEQKEIVDYLDSKCADIDTAISQKQQQLEILNKYKKSLIYEYVTGKKEVPSSWQN